MKKSKVILTYYDEEDNIAEEKVWVEQINDLIYQIKNIPFFAPNIAYDDIIKVEKEEEGLYFDEIVETSEHSTIQVIFFKESIIEDVIKQLELFGCSWEGFDNQKLLAVDILPKIDYSEIQQYLDSLLEKGELDYREACLSSTHSEKVK